MFEGMMFLAVIFGLFLALSVRVLNQYERGVVFRLGNLVGARGPGLIILIPVIERMVRVDLRTKTFDVPPQDIITKDNVTVKVNAVIFFRVVEPNRAVNEVENFILATSKLAQTTLRAVVGQEELDTVLSNREGVNHQLQEILDNATEPWGVKVENVEVKQVDLPIEMQRAMAKQAEAERERRAKVIAAEGEYQASIKLAEAAEVMSKQPNTLQLRYLQTLMELVGDKATTIIPFPVDIMDKLTKK